MTCIRHQTSALWGDTFQAIVLGATGSQFTALSTLWGLITVLYYIEGRIESFLFLFLQVVLNSQGVHPALISHPETFNCRV